MAVTKIERPDIVDYEHLEYLDSLRAMKIDKPFVSYLMREFRISNQDAIIILAYWMNSYSERHPNK